MKTPRLYLALLASGLLLTACIVAPHHGVTEETVVSFTQVEDLAAAQAALDFPLLVPDPADLPAGLAVQSVYVVPGGEQGGATLQYGAGERTLSLHISTVPAHAQGFEWRSDLGGPSESVIVRGTEGYWAPRIGELSWIEDGRLYRLQGTFSRADMLRIAEGLHPFKVPTPPTLTAVPAPASEVPTEAPTFTPYPRPTLTAPTLPGRLVYGSAGDVWIVERGQSPRVLLTGGRNPHLSPTGDRLLFLRANPELPYLSDLWLADFTCPAAPAPCQVNERRLIGPAEYGSPLIYGLAWSPDGRTVALTMGSDAKRFYSEDLWLVDMETGDYRQVLDDGGGEPDYSLDGAWIALSVPGGGWNQGQLSLIAADGSGYRPLFDQLISYEGRWLPDGVLIAGLIRLERITEAEVTAELWQVPVVGEPVRLALIPAAHNFRWSADGRRLAYLADDPAGWLHIAQADGSEPVAVPGTDERTWPHSWSPGRQFLAVVHDERYFFLSDGPDPALIPMPASFRFWLDDDSYLATEWVSDDPQTGQGHFEVSRTWLDGRREFLFVAESLNGLAYQP